MSTGPKIVVNYVHLQKVLKKSRKGYKKSWRNLVLTKNIYQSCP